MPVFYNFTQDGLTYSFDDIFVPADLFREGNLFTWGAGSNGALGNASTTDRSTPVTTFAGGANWKQISLGDLDTVAIKTDGTLWTWGAGDYGVLGNNQTTNKSTPVTTFAGGNNWKQVACGRHHMAAIKTDGTLWTWGRVVYGALGNASTFINRTTEVTTFAGGTNWKQVSCSGRSTAAIKTDGTLWTWGSGTSGRLGNGVTTGTISTPVTTFAGGTNWKQVDCGYSHVAAIKTDGTLWTWGIGSNGILGNNQTTNKSTPVTTFAGGTDWKQASAGQFNVAAIKTDGTLWIWGSGNNLGTNDITTRSTPVTTFAGGNNWKQVSSGEGATAAIKTDGTLWIWGSGTRGTLGTNDTTSRSTPVTTFAGRNDWKQVSVGKNTAGTVPTAALTYIDPVI
jgi:alpha-tubulin suppressor-like RCC1 family protein